MDELKRGEREQRSSPRAGVTWEPIIGGQKIFLHTGEFADGRLCEIFIDASDQGTFLQAALKGFAIAFSLALQHGAPLCKMCKAYRNSKFEPCGPVANDVDIKWASSIFDYISQRLWLNYGDERPPKNTAVEANGAVQPSEVAPPEPPPVELDADRLAGALVKLGYPVARAWEVANGIRQHYDDDAPPEAAPAVVEANSDGRLEIGRDVPEKVAGYRSKGSGA